MRKRKPQRVGKLTWMPGSSSSQKDSYLDTFHHFRNDLSILREVNQSLPQSVQQMAERRRREIQRRKSKLSRGAALQLDAFLTNIKKRKMGKTLSLTGEAAQVVWQLVSGMIFENRSVMFIRDMSLVYLITSFEDFLHDIMLAAFTQKPEIMSTKGKSVTLEELFKCKDLEALLDAVREREIQSCLNQNIEGVDDYFRNRFKIAISQFPDWKQFAERFYRRNIIIHNSGMVNDIYRNKTGYRGADTRMTVTEDYLRQSIDIFEVKVMKLSKTFAKKFGRVRPSRGL